MSLKLSDPNQARPQSLSALVVLALLAAVLGSFYRFTELGLRPMHADEAILGMKFIDFWQTGHFDYDPKDYHGPVLHYVTWVYGKIVGWHDLAALTPQDLRFVVALLGMGVVFSTLLVSDALGRRATGLAMLMIALSPMQVFYSRYYIMEMAFVLEVALFMFASWRFARSRYWIWVLVAGTALGAMHATKETFVINMAAIFCGWVAARLGTEGFVRKRTGMFLGDRRKTNWKGSPALWGLIISLIVSVALFSGGFRFWEDAKESVLTYLSYLQRSGGAGHEKPWYFYIALLVWRQDVFIWTEAMIVVLGLLGMAQAFFGSFQKDRPRQAFLVFLSVYVLTALAAYSIIPYKTPWTILSVQHALTLLAGVGANWIISWSRWKIWKSLCGILLAAGFWHLCLQNMYTMNDRGRANLRAPYVYSHTSDSAVKLAQRLRTLYLLHREDFGAQVINMDSGWPLPWYLRDIQSIGYQQHVPSRVDSPVVVVDADMAAEVHAKLVGKEYESDFYGLRPGVNVVLMVRKDWWQALQKGSAP